MRLPVPTMMCNQKIVLTKVYQSQTSNMFHELKQDDPVTIHNCVVHMATKYSGTNSNRQLVANGTVFLYADVSSPLPSLSKNNLGSKIEFAGNEYTVQTIIENKQPLSDELFAYQLEVL